MNIYGIALLLSSVLAAAYYILTNKETVPIDPYNEYEEVADAAIEYKEKYGEYAKELIKLAPYIENKNILLSRRYSLSLDGKFLTVSNLPENEASQLINEIGGESYINGRFTYLTLRRKNDLSKIKPIAHFSIKPDNKITTTTVIQYDTSGCIAENNEILEKKWENKQVTFKEPGIYKISLKIKDKNGNWSDAFEREIKVTEETGIRGISCYDGTMFVIYRNGKVLSKGKNEFGQLGLGTLTAINELKYNSLYDGVFQVECGENFNIFRFSDGTVCAAGTNRNGELASGDKNSQKTLNVIWGLENIKQIAAGKNFGAALDYSGNVYVWGDNSDNQLMKDDIADSIMPIRLDGLENIKAISLGANFGFGINYDGTVIGWGDNTHGQLGIGYKGRISEPVVTLYKNVASMAAGDKFSLALTEAGRIFGAGNNAYGQLGTKGKVEFLFPTEILKLKDITRICAKESLATAINQFGKAFVWGNFNSPGMKPIYEPEEIPNVNYVEHMSNTGKKCFYIDSNQTLNIVVDLSGRNETRKLYDNFYDFIQNDTK